MAAENEMPQRQYVYKTIGETKLTVSVDYPDDWKAGDKRPAIVFFFGGAWTNGGPSQFSKQAAYFAKRGLVCARPDYRTKSKTPVTIDECVKDAISAMRWVRKNAAMLGIDPNRIVASGGSAGGHLAACLFFTEGIASPDDDPTISPKPNAMILFNPPLDLVPFHGTELDKMTTGMAEATVAKISPLRHVRKDTPPTLIIDGTEDRFNKQITEFIDKSKQLGAPVEGAFSEGQPHGFFNYSPWMEKTTAEADEFLVSLGYLKEEPKVALPTNAGQPKKGKSKKNGLDQE